jgi:4-alpha-glucanotransferase
MQLRTSGVLAHLTSLPGGSGVGDLGAGARRFVDLLAAAGQRYWQLLPTTHTTAAGGHSPYNAVSAFAGDPLLVSLEELREEGLLEERDLEPPEDADPGRVDYRSVAAYKRQALDYAFARSRSRTLPGIEDFREGNAAWLDDTALFLALRNALELRSWSSWPSELQRREPAALADARRRLAERIEREVFVQYCFHRQWKSLRRYARHRGVQLIGDMPYYVSYESADVWARPELFLLDETGRPTHVSGVPPDYFSATGQLWGNPIYRWGAHREEGFGWWLARLEHALGLVDLLRIDHFRAFSAFWQVSAGEETALNGSWQEAPGRELFSALLRRRSSLPLIAEDLGTIDAEVRELMSRFDLPGMRVLLFAWGTDFSHHPYVPHCYPRRCVAYTGTHDNNTARGWWESEATPEERDRLRRYLGREVEAHSVHREMIRLLASSVADLVVFPLQDVLGLGADARLNFPGTTEGNWRWRVRPEQLTEEAFAHLAEVTRVYGRS